MIYINVYYPDAKPILYRNSVSNPQRRISLKNVKRLNNII